MHVCGGCGGGGGGGGVCVHMCGGALEQTLSSIISGPNTVGWALVYKVWYKRFIYNRDG